MNSVREASTSNQQLPSDVEDIMRITRLCMEVNVYQWNNKLFKQTKESPMGSPASVVFAELTMQSIEKHILETIQFSLLMWKRYVDDCFAIVKTCETDELLWYINEIDTNIQFTVGKERNRTLPLLYVRSPGGHILLQSRIFFFDLAEIFFCTFWTPRTKKLQEKICLSSVCVCVSVCLMSECKICHQRSCRSSGPICMKFCTLVYVWDT